MARAEEIYRGAVSDELGTVARVLHDGDEDRRSWVGSCHLLSEFTQTGQRRAQRGAGHLKDPFERPIEFQDQKNRTGNR